MKSLVQGWWVAAALAASACGVSGSEDVGASKGPSESRRLSYDELDLTAPETVASLSPEPDASGEHHGPVTVTLHATDDFSGVASITYVLNGAMVGGARWGAIPSSSRRSTSLASRPSPLAVDVAGNIEYSHDLNINIVVGEEPGPEPTPEPGPEPTPEPEPGLVRAMRSLVLSRRRSLTRALRAVRSD